MGAQKSTGEDVLVPGVNLSCSPGPVIFGDKLYIFHQGTKENGELWYVTSSDGGQTWASEQRVSSFGISYSPSGVVFNGKLYVFHHGKNRSGELWYTTSTDGVSWVQDVNTYMGITDSPSAVVYKGKLYVFHQGTRENGEVWFNTSSDGVNWVGDSRIPDVGMSASPSTVVFKDVLYLFLFYQGRGDSGTIWYQTFNGTSWSSAKQIANFGISASPGAAIFAGSSVLYVFHHGSGQGGELWYTKTTDGTNWLADMRIQGLSVSWSPAAIECMGKLMVFYQGGGDNGQLWKHVHDSMEIVSVEYDMDNAITRDQVAAIIYTQYVPNNTSTEQTTQVELAESVEETNYFENSSTSSVSVAIGATFSASIPVVKAEVGGALELGLSESQTCSYGESYTNTKAYKTTVPVTVPPYTQIKVTFSVSKCLLDVPYTMYFRSSQGYESSCQGTYEGLTSWGLQTAYEEIPLGGT